MNKVNYQLELDKILESIDPGKKPRLLMHSCCAPCSSYCLVYLRKWFEITCLYFNPNITDEAEYIKRYKELERLADILNDEACNDGTISVIDGGFSPNTFFEISKGFEDCPERGARCTRCFELRIGNAVEKAFTDKYDYVTTTLTLSPLKDEQLINSIGRSLCGDGKYPTKWLVSDFKKRGGYQASIELSRKYGLYRQNYCGCVYSKR